MKLTKAQEKIISKVREYVKKECIGFSKIDDVFEGHILGVVSFAEKLAEEYNANKFVVVLAAYLHDITHIQTHNHKTHEIEGSKFVLEYLKQFDISQKEIDLVSLCILNHRGSKNHKKESIEEKIVACADAMDHINRCLRMFYRANNKGDSYEVSAKFISEKLQRSWKKIELDKARNLVSKKYEAAKLLFGF